jgi:hypothetical protein
VQHGIGPAIPHENTFCYCGRGEDVEQYGEMIECDNASCSIGWFHCTCIGITVPVEQFEQVEWLCPTCKRLRSLSATGTVLPPAIVPPPPVLKYTPPTAGTTNSDWARRRRSRWTSQFRTWFDTIAAPNALRLHCPDPRVNRVQVKKEMLPPNEADLIPRYTVLDADGWVEDNSGEPWLFLIRSGAIAMTQMTNRYMTAVYDSIYMEEPTLFDVGQAIKNARDTKTGIIFHGGAWITQGSMSRLPVMTKESATGFYVWDLVKTANEQCGLYSKLSGIKDDLQGLAWRTRMLRFPQQLAAAALTPNMPGHLCTLNFNAIAADHRDVKNWEWGVMPIHGNWTSGGGRLVFHDQELVVATRPGDIVACRFEKVRHAVEPLVNPNEQRYSQVCVEHSEVVAAYEANGAAQRWMTLQSRQLIGGTQLPGPVMNPVFPPAPPARHRHTLATIEPPAEEEELSPPSPIAKRVRRRRE